MSFFLAIFTHHDKALRAQHMDAHIDWLDLMVQREFVVLSGPLSDGPLADAPVTAALVLRADSKGEALRMVATDPFFVHGVTDGLTLTEWDPVFGLLAEQSHGREGLRAAPTD